MLPVGCVVGCPILGGMLSLNKQIRRQASETEQREQEERVWADDIFTNVYTFLV